MPDLPKKSYYRVDEVALYFDISVKTLYGLIQEGKVIDKNFLLFVSSIRNVLLCVKKILTTKCRVQHR